MTGCGRTLSQKVHVRVCVCVVREGARLQNIKESGFSCVCLKNHFSVRALKAGARLRQGSRHDINCVRPLVQRSDLGRGSDPPGRVLQSAADLAHLLLPEIHHGQMDPAVLTHTDFPVCAHKDTKGRDMMDERALRLAGLQEGRKSSN